MQTSNHSDQNVLNSGASDRLPGGNYHTIRDANRTLVLNLIRNSEPISRADLMRLTGLTRGAVSNIVTRLLEERLVREISLGRSTGGRRPVMLKMAAEFNRLGAIDVRPRLTTLAVADLSGHILNRATIPTELNQPAAFLIKCARQLKSMLAQRVQNIHRVLGVGMIVPGIVSADRTTIVESSELEWNNISIVEAAHTLGFPLILENDANAIALAELYFGHAHFNDSFVSILLQSDSIGAGMYLDGELIRGETNQSGEIACMIVDPHGAACSCGRQGCLTTVASSYSVVRRYKYALNTRRERTIEPIQDLTSKALSRAVQLSWSIDTELPRQYHIYRHSETPVPIDAEHQIGIASRASFIDHPPENKPHHYVVVAVDHNERPSIPSDPIKQAPGPAVMLFQDYFASPALEAYTIEGPTPPEPTDGSLLFGHRENDHNMAMIWRNNEEAVDIRAKLTPVEAGIYDTCGVLFKVQDSEHWYCAVLAYGAELKGGKTLSLIRQSGDGDEWLAFHTMEITVGQTYEIRTQITPNWIRIKAWHTDNTEPAEWHISLRDDSGWKSGGIGFRCYGRLARADSLVAESFVSNETPAQTNIGGILDHDDPTLMLILERARQGDEAALRVLDDAGKALGLSVYNLQRLLGVKRFVFAGPFVDQGWELLFSSIEKRLAELKLEVGQDILVEQSSLESNASILGALGAASASVFEYIIQGTTNNS